MSFPIDLYIISSIYKYMAKIGEHRQKFASLDLKDRKILYELDANARQSASEIGKKIGLSKQVVVYRIGKLLEMGIIQKFFAILDTSRLGFTTYKIFIRLQNTDISKQNEIIDYIKNNERIQFFISTDGMFDLVFNVLAKDVNELYAFIRELENRYGNYIAEKELVIMIFSTFFSRDYFFDKKPTQIRKSMFFGSEAVPIKIDKMDEAILSILGIDARTSVNDIAKKVNLNADTVGVRIKKLEKARVIQNYAMLPDFSLLNQGSYKVMFSLRNLTEEKEKSLMEYSNTHPNIWFHSKSLGRWDLEMNMDVDNASQFRNIMMEIKSNFSDVIKEYTTLQVSKIHKFNFYPFKV